ncbi:hypothetical protein K461DRAFT_265905 [Myriangium duriaei CBS 260.36]|uniref:Uncharacterized protein n=1 Tax=Myriangium duriaei CBS 260.36 TaxID=1168546 RepID=A0A9P4J716_9PEZI|nr:hypothetical protein K461DRAFT_265905 [Myriangium duriaei CBS 260.36]
MVHPGMLLAVLFPIVKTATAASVQFAVSYHSSMDSATKVKHYSGFVPDSQVRNVINNMRSWSEGRYYATTTTYGVDVKIINSNAIGDSNRCYDVKLDMERILNHHI